MGRAELVPALLVGKEDGDALGAVSPRFERPPSRIGGACLRTARLKDGGIHPSHDRVAVSWVKRDDGTFGPPVCFCRTCGLLGSVKFVNLLDPCLQEMG